MSEASLDTWNDARRSAFSQALGHDRVDRVALEQPVLQVLRVAMGEIAGHGRFKKRCGMLSKETPGSVRQGRGGMPGTRESVGGVRQAARPDEIDLGSKVRVRSGSRPFEVRSS